MKTIETLNKKEIDQNHITVIKPIDNLSSIKNALNEISKIKETLLDDNDIINIRGKKYINKRGYRKIAIAFSISTEVVNEKRIQNGDELIYDFTIRAISPIGRYTESSASCSSVERDYAHLNHDIRATAQTRASNRAISDLIGLGEVSYEEIKDNNYTPYKDIKYMENEIITDKQKELLIKLVDSKYKDDSKRKVLYKKINELSKQDARYKIKSLLDEGVIIN